MKKVVLAYSGGLDTSVILHWLIQTKNYAVTCFVADVGQQEDFEAIKNKALSVGAYSVIIQDLKCDFIENYVFKALKAAAIYEGSYLLGTALSRPLIAQKQIALAQELGISAVAHGATGKGNDQVRFELMYMSLMPDVEIISPWKDKSFLAQFQGRTDLIAYAQKHNIPVDSTLSKPYSIDENIMHTSYESGVLEDPAHYEDVYKRTKALTQTPDTSSELSIVFRKGIPVAVITDQKTITGSLELFQFLNTLGAVHGIGRIDIVENRFIGFKSRGLYETPAGTILYKAHADIESITLDKEVAHLKAHMSLVIAQLIYNGLSNSPEMNFLMAAIEESQKHVAGTVKLELYKGNVIIKGRSSHRSLYNQALVSMDKAGGYNQEDAAGFIKLHGLRLKLMKGLQ